MRPIAMLLAALVAAGALVTGAGAQGNGTPAADGPIIERFLSNTEPRLHSYRALRVLEAETRGGRMRARLVAWTSLDPERGFEYSVASEEGSEMIRKKVLRAALEAERTIWAAGEADRGALVPANYDFAADGGDAGRVRIAIRPKRSDTMLIEGSILVNEDDGDLVQVEGRLIKRPSFWTRRVDVVRRYERLAGVRVPSRMESTASVMFVGQSTFSMRFAYTSVNGTPLLQMDEPLLAGAEDTVHVD